MPFATQAWGADMRVTGVKGLIWTLLAVISAGAAQFSAPWAHAKSSDAADDSAAICQAVGAEAEKKFRLPPQLLTAIGMAETGRWNPENKRSFAWPWTVTSGQQSWYLKTKAAAIAKVAELKKAGTTNIDVGCFQINLRYHPSAFRDLDEAFDPVANATYAAKLLAKLRDEKKSWTDAVALYHSATPVHAERYRAKVYGLWRKERAHALDDQKAATEAAAEARRHQAEERRKEVEAERMKVRVELALAKAQRAYAKVSSAAATD